MTTYANNLLKRLNIAYPVIQAPMLGVTSPAMVAEISNAGGLGSLPVGGVSPDNTQALIREVKARTDRPFAVNIFVHDLPKQIDEDAFYSMQDKIAEFCSGRHILCEKKSIADLKLYSYRDNIDVLVQEKIPVISFTFGMPDADSTQRLHSAGSLLVGTATSVGEAKFLENNGVDMVTVQGIEAGGHRGTFIHSSLPQVGLFSLLPQVVDAVSIPVIAAGGIYNGKTATAAFALGASGVTAGSIFIAADESLASEAYKNAVLNSKETDTVLTKACTGRWARALPNDFLNFFESLNMNVPDYALQNHLVAPIRTHGHRNNIADYLFLLCGQSVNRTRKSKSSEIFKTLIEGMEDSPVK
jgi:nitronate monooxygenase